MIVCLLCIVEEHSLFDSWLWRELVLCLSLQMHFSTTMTLWHGREKLSGFELKGKSKIRFTSSCWHGNPLLKISLVVISECNYNSKELYNTEIENV